jgi:hypothetical protein
MVTSQPVVRVRNRELFSVGLGVQVLQFVQRGKIKHVQSARPRVMISAFRFFSRCSRIPDLKQESFHGGVSSGGPPGLGAGAYTSCQMYVWYTPGLPIQSQQLAL